MRRAEWGAADSWKDFRDRTVSPRLLRMELEGRGVRSPGSAPKPLCDPGQIPCLSCFPCVKWDARRPCVLNSNSTSPDGSLTKPGELAGGTATTVPTPGQWVAPGLSHPLPRPGACSRLVEYQSLAWTPRPATCFFWMWFQWMGLATAGRAGAGSPAARRNPACLTASTFTPTLLPRAHTGCGSLCPSTVSSSPTAPWTPMAM